MWNNNLQEVSMNISLNKDLDKVNSDIILNDVIEYQVSLVEKQKIEDIKWLRKISVNQEYMAASQHFYLGGYDFQVASIEREYNEKIAIFRSTLYYRSVDEIKDDIHKKYRLGKHKKSSINYDDESIFAELCKKGLHQFTPSVFHAEIDRTVARYYGGDYSRYRVAVKLYFEKITKFDLWLMECSRKQLKEYSFQKEGYELQANKSNNSDVVDWHTTYRVLNKKRKKLMAHAQSLLLLAGKNGRMYCCDTVLHEYINNMKAQIKFIESNFVLGQSGEMIELKNCVKTHEMDLAEKVNLSRTMDKLAQKNGMMWSFVTLTVLPQYHPNPIKGSNSYDGTAIDESARDVNKRFNNVRAILSKSGINIMYVKVSEVHQDGCFHFHILVYHKQNHLDKLKSAFVLHFPNLLDDKGNMKKGAFTTQNKELANATSGANYIFKYITKAVTYYNPDIDFSNLGKSELNTLKNCAMRSFNAIRGIQFGGISSCLTKFRFLARNISKFDLPIWLQVCLEENNLFAFIDDGWCDEVETIYAEVENYKKEKSKRFVGVRIKCSSATLIKSFFKMFKNDMIKDVDENKEELIALIEKKKKRVLQGVKVLVNHNYSSGSQKQLQKQNQMLLE